MDFFDTPVNELKNDIENDQTTQNIIVDFLLKTYENKMLLKRLYAYEGKSAALAMIYIITGEVKFPEYISEKLNEAGKQKKYDATANANYRDVALEFFNIKDQSSLCRYIDYYYGDVTRNRTSDTVGRSAKGLSRKRKESLTLSYANKTVKEVFESLVNEIRESEYLALDKKDKKVNGVKYAQALLDEVYKNSFMVKDSLILKDIVYDKELVEDILLDTSISEMVKEQLILARVGQGTFRRGVIKRNHKCPFTGISDENLLVASHIKPWKDSSNSEKIDPQNGLALTPMFDHLFDNGLISFTEDKKLMISSELGMETRLKIGIVDQMLVSDLLLLGKTLLYMEYHRNNVFKP